MTERERWGLRGPVQSCQLQNTLYLRYCGADACETGERNFMTVLDFHVDGSITRRWHKNQDGSEWTSSYEYDRAGRLVTLQTGHAAGIVHLQLYEYEVAERLARVISRPKNGDDRIAESYEYDAAGRKKKTFYVDVAAKRADTHYAFGVEGTDSGYSAPGATTLTTLYNERDLPTELIFHDETGRLLSRVAFGYDAAGRLVKEAQTSAEEMLPPEIMTSLNQPQRETLRALFGAGGEPVRRLHRYNEQGLKAETRSRMGPLGGDCKTMAYNELGI